MEVTVENIRKQAESASLAKDYFVVEAEISRTGRISVFLDSEAEINIEDCALVSAHLSEAFGETLDKYELTVSSAGLDRPMTHIRQLKKHLTREVEIKKADGLKFIALLTGVEEDKITFSEKEIIKKGQKPRMKDPVTLSLKEIKSITPVITFKK
jgi:ribosome maturation factor RimP